MRKTNSVETIYAKSEMLCMTCQIYPFAVSQARTTIAAANHILTSSTISATAVSAGSPHIYTTTSYSLTGKH